MRHVALLALSLTLASSLAADAANVVRIEVFPPDVHLTTKRDRQSLVVQAFLDNGLTQDVTTEAKLTLGNANLVRIEGAVLHPAADGSTELAVEYAGHKVVVPVTVKDAAVDPPISFKLDVMPVFSKAGCNTGSCHGAARGKDGFRLSLFGFDPDGDYHRLTREINGRRINLALVHESLVLEKGAGRVPHTGGTRFDDKSELYQTIVRWLEAGAPMDPADIARPVGIEIYPRNAVLDGKGTTQRLTVRAKYSDGTDRDVTGLAYFMTSNEQSAAVSQEGIVTAGDRGEAFIMARFDAFTVGSPFIVLPKGLQFEFPKIPENNYIDTLVNAKLMKLRIVPSPLCSDEVFLRRAYLDICGLLPTREEYERFISSTDPNKREKLVDELLGRKEFVEIWVMKWAELLQIRTSPQVSYKAMLLYYNWLQDKIARNVPMDEMVQELLACKGGTFRNPATNYYQQERDILKIAENVAQVFMGMRIQCAQCHNHPFDRWTMDDYYSFAAFFAQIGRKNGDDPRETIVFNSGGGEVRHLVGNRVMQPKFLGGATPDVNGKDRREVLAKWLASPENPYFATNLANIVWAHFFGRGIVEPVDDVRVSNPPSNPELLAELGKRFTEYKYDFKKLVRDICTSRTYQLSTETNETNAEDLTNFSHAYVRRIRAEVLLDCITQVTETKNKFQGLPLGARAVQIADGQASTYFLTTFGRATRETVCSCEVKMEPTLSQSLHLLNGDTVNRKVQEGNVVGRMLAEKKMPSEIIEELYIRTLTRKPTNEELLRLSALVTEQPDQKQALEDVFWALLNSREFMFNH
ncbi:MAG: DUF1549 domain-containing protein [Gemmatales bacterium]|nr:DUF1549 domain-containing protein [Gemmatales bacterium]MDW8387475.1 DUF1549 domain-containing protein [Gemmatales bacterium]